MKPTTQINTLAIGLLSLLLFSPCCLSEKLEPHTGDGRKKAFDASVLINQFHNTSDKGVETVHIEYPFNHAIFPREIVAPSLYWSDSNTNSELWLIALKTSGLPKPLILLSDGSSPDPTIDPEAHSPYHDTLQASKLEGLHTWQLSPKIWELIKAHAEGTSLNISIYGLSKKQPEHLLSSGSVEIEISDDPLQSPIFYRDVPLMPAINKKGTIQPLDTDALDLVTWRLRDISKEYAPAVLSRMPTCANCHSFSQDGRKMGIDMDGPNGDKGAYAIADLQQEMMIEEDDIISWNSFKGTPDEHLNFGLFSQISPDGRYVVSTLNESVYVQNFTNVNFIQSFYPTRGILVVYDTMTGEMKPLPGASSTDYVQSNAVWTPDGKTLIFSRAKAKDKNQFKRLAAFSGDAYETQIQYDLYSIPFNDGNGGTSLPIKGASQNGKSNSFPKVSPDGKWIVFVQSQNGQLLRPDSKLYIIPTRGGIAREMNCNLDLMNSWHSWSPTGKWMVFSSKGMTPFTQMFLTHIDENGIDSPAVLIPNSTAANRAVNIPEFIYSTNGVIQSIKAPTQLAYRHNVDGIKLAKQGKLEDALIQFSKAVELNSYFSDAYAHKGVTLLRLKRYDEAYESLEEAMRLTPNRENIHSNMGAVLEAIDLEKAISYYEEKISQHPQFRSLRVRLVEIYLALEEFDKLLPHTRYLHEQNPNDAEIVTLLGTALYRLRQFKEAASFFAQALTHDPDNINNLINLSWCLSSKPKSTPAERAEAVSLSSKAAELSNHSRADALDALAFAYAVQENYTQALVYGRKALSIAKADKNEELVQEISHRITQYTKMIQK